MPKWSKYVLASVFLTLSVVTFSQSKSQLQQKQKNLQSQIQKMNGMLNELSKNKKISEVAYIINVKKIEAREQLIESINDEIGDLDRKIAIQEGLIDSLQRQITLAREQYAKMLVYAYKNRNAVNSVIFVFSAPDFQIAYKRLKYLKKIGEYREYQAKELRVAQEKIEGKIAFLETQKARKKQALGNKYYEKQKLTAEKSENQEALQSLQKDEISLRKKIKKKQREAAQLNKQIEEIIQREIRLAQERARKERQQNSAVENRPKNPLKIELNKVDGALSDNFAGNQGKLPWPVPNGTISAKFGANKHPVLHEVTVNNNGINILTTKGVDATAIFDGSVVAVIVLPSGGKSAVLVQHGAYFTMYSNLSTVKVKKGQKVKIGQKLGTIKTEDDGRTEIHFELWKGGEKQNPALWIKSV